MEDNEISNEKHQGINCVKDILVNVQKTEERK